MLEMAGASGRIMWQPDAFFGGAAVAVDLVRDGGRSGTRR